jgi:hypothetical protein
VTPTLLRDPDSFDPDSLYVTPTLYKREDRLKPGLRKARKARKGPPKSAERIFAGRCGGGLGVCGFVGV